MTLLEVMVAVAILSMISLLIYGAFDSLQRGKKGESIRSERSHQARAAVLRIARELTSTFISQHIPQNKALIVRNTGFIAQNGAFFDRLDFTSFSHVRVEKDAKESDQCELGFFVVRDPEVEGKMDLVRREQTPIDLDIQKGGVVNVLAENVSAFELKYLDPITAQWLDSWDSTQSAAQFNRVPFEVKVTLTLKAVPQAPEASFTTKVLIPVQQPLTFGILQ